MRLVHAALGLCMLGGCTERPEPMDAPAAAPSARAAELPQREVIPERPPAAEPAVDEIPLSAIGYEHEPTISAAARAQNRAALKLHRQGDYAGSREGFAKAVALSPDHDLARFNLACALARLGELQSASAELSTLLHRDLLRFQGRWRGAEADADLQSLRESKHAPELDALVERLRVTYDAAHDRGIPAYLYRHSPIAIEVVDYDEFATGGTSGLIAGAWVQEAGRFVPLARGGTLALLDLPRRRMLRATVALEVLHCDFGLGVPTVESLSTAPRPEAQWHSRAKVDDETAGLSPDDYSMSPLHDLSFGFAGEDVLVAVDWHDGILGTNVSFGLGRDGAVRETKRGVDLAGMWVRVLGEGGRFHADPPEGYALAGRKLTVPGRAAPLELDRRYEHVFATTDPSAPVFVMRRRFAYDRDSFDPIFDTTVVRVDVQTGESERIASGEGSGWVVIGPEGRVFIETGGRTRHWASARAASSAPTMEGLHLTMAMEPPFCNCCG